MNRLIAYCCAAIFALNAYSYDIAVADSVVKDSAAKTMRKSSIDATKYILDKRYINYGDEFAKKHSYDHWYFEFGIGAEQFVPYSEKYKYDMFTKAYGSIGKNLSRNHSLRATLELAFGHQPNVDKMLYRAGGKLDYIFSLSSYLNGYKPDRTMELSTVMGVGLVKSYRHGGTQISPEAHAGLQFRFYTGPQGYINVEPYFGMAPDFIDLCSQSWRRYDVFYGVNLSYVYYLGNNLSKQARQRFIDKGHHLNNPLVSDSVTYRSWMAPFFVELSTGAAVSGSPKFEVRKTMGRDMSVSLGKWFSPSIGVRVSVNGMETLWDQTVQPATSSRPKYVTNYNTTNYSVRMEGMFNPLGLKRNYSWNSRFGFHFLAGYGLGWMYRDGRKSVSGLTHAYTGGVQLWTALNDGVRLFIEPRFTSLVHRVDYYTSSASSLHKEKKLHCNLGLSVLLKSDKYRRDETEGMGTAEQLPFTIGGGIGMPMRMSRGNMKGDSGLPDLNVAAFGQYHFDDVNSLRLSLDYVSFVNNQMSSYTDTYPNGRKVSRWGMWRRRYHIGLFSADYSVNMTNLFCDRVYKRRLNLELFFGPTMAVSFGETSKLYSRENKQDGHKYSLKSRTGLDYNFGVNGGMNLSYTVNDDLDIYVSPTYYLFRNMPAPVATGRPLALIETVNVGVKHHF